MPRKKNSKAQKQPPKKRGRKPKGGKIINSIKENKIVDTTTENIILHLNGLMIDGQVEIYFYLIAI